MPEGFAAIRFSRQSAFGAVKSWTKRAAKNRGKTVFADAGFLASPHSERVGLFKGVEW